MRVFCWVGIENGVEPAGDMLEAFAWVVVIASDDLIGIGRTGSFLLPHSMSQLIKEGIEQKHALDIVSGREPEKHYEGTVGYLTDDIITRRDYYIPAVVFALIPFKNPELFSRN